MNVLFLFIYIDNFILPANPDATYGFFPMTAATPIPLSWPHGRIVKYPEPSILCNLPA